MRYQVNFTIDVASQQEAVSLRDQAKAWLDDQGATVTHWSASRVDSEWRVYGWDDTTGAFAETAIAETAIAAGSIVAGTATGRHIVHTEAIR